jgi:hypothetical protein
MRRVRSVWLREPGCKERAYQWGSVLKYAASADRASARDRESVWKDVRVMQRCVEPADGVGLVG